MPDGDITLGEVSRNIAALRDSQRQEIRALEGRMTNQYVELNRRLDGLTFVSQDTYRAEMTALKEDVDDLKDSRKWMSRTLVAAFLFPLGVAAIIALVVSYA